MTSVIFLGPTLSVSDARAILPDAIFLPPLGQSELISAVSAYNPDVVGIIDGVFFQNQSVWHKEILHTLSLGVRVYGASSMGALRAAETHSFGMIGVGEVYKMFTEEGCLDDDEVALAHGDERDGYNKVSEPMVNIRFTLSSPFAKDRIVRATREKCVSIAKGIYFPERTIPRILSELEKSHVDGHILVQVKDLFANHYVDIKAEDAKVLLRRIQSEPYAARIVPPWELAPSYLFDALYNRDRYVLKHGTNVALSTISEYTTLHHGQFAELNFSALNRVMMGTLAQMLDLEVSEAEIKETEGATRLRLGISEEMAFQAWLKRNDVNASEFVELTKQLAQCRKLHRWFLTERFLDRNVKAVLDELRLRGEYVEFADRAALQEMVLQGRDPEFNRRDDGTPSTDELVAEHVRCSDWRPGYDINQWIFDSGFRTIEDFRLALIRARLFRAAMTGAAEALLSTCDENT